MSQPEYIPTIENSIEEGHAITIEKIDGRMRIERVTKGELAIFYGDTIPEVLAELEAALVAEAKAQVEVESL